MAALTKLAPSRMTVEEFLDWPGDGSERKFQLIEGEPVAMAPASVTHGIIQANVVGLLRTISWAAIAMSWWRRALFRG